MKKVLYLLLTLLMAFAMCAAFSGCGSDGSGDATGESTTKAQEAHADPTNLYADMAGDYMDKVSQRASATLSADMDSENVEIVVRWSSSASEETQWTMHATMNGDNQLVYSDCQCQNIVYDEDGNRSSETEYSDGEGYFEFTEDGELAWIGAQDENCRECIFVQTEG